MTTPTDSLLRQAAALHQRGALTQAAEIYRQVLLTDPRNTDALHLLGVAETQGGNPQTGLELIDRSLQLNPQQPVAVVNRGNCLMALRRFQDALACYETALGSAPTYVLAHFGRGNALAMLSQPAQALASFERAAELAPGFLGALAGCSGALLQLQRHEEVIAVCDRALRLQPDNANILLNRGTALAQLQRHAESLHDMDRAVAAAPGLAEAHCGRGVALLHMKQLPAAIAALERAAALDAHLKPALFWRGMVLSEVGRFEEAIAALRPLAGVDPAYEQGLSACLHRQAQVCNWFEFGRSLDDIEKAVDNDVPVDHIGGLFIALCGSASRQHRWARNLVARHRPPLPALSAGTRYAHDRIRVGYVSADFLEAPTSRLMAGLFERHDRSRFEIFGISLREEDSAMTRRVRAAFEHYVPVGARSNAGIAAMMREMELDIAVDLMGYTGLNRVEVFAHRPAPVQVNYLGFPAGMGSVDMDYIIADAYMIPRDHRADYTEAVVCMPDCFQVNDDRRVKAASAGSRAAFGLPDSAFVWSALHSSFKLNPAMFDLWMRLMLTVPESVLWLVGGNTTTEGNLRREAAARGVDPRRLVFSAVLPYSQHLARLSLADVCLDPFPYNGGATSSDALWAGLPVVTCSGKSFASRYSGSLLTALQMPELICGSFDEYEDLARNLARDPARLAALRAKLARNSRSSPVFQTDRFRRHLELAYTLMLERHRSGQGPAPIEVPALPI